MGRMFALLFIILLALSFMFAYLFLTKNFTAGEQQLIDGQRQLEKGQKMLAEGKAKLESGKQKMSRAKEEYRNVNNIPFMVIINKLPIIGMVIGDATKQIAEGDKLIAKGAVNVKMGEKRLEEARSQLSQGKGRLGLVNSMRIVCVVGAFFFLTLFILLGFYWRQSLARIFKHADS